MSEEDQKLWNSEEGKAIRKKLQELKNQPSNKTIAELEKEIARLKAIIEKLTNSEELNPQATFPFPSPPRIDR